MRNAKFLSALIVALLIIYFSSGCQYHKSDLVYPCDTTIVRRSVEIKSILDANCQNCHSPTTADDFGNGYNLYDYPTINSLATNTFLCSEGQLISAVTHDNVCALPMPKGQPMLNDCDINKFRAWVNRGAPDN
ncbi:MAG: hypothetical protein ABJA79_00315 [Parafilimonas sp.]